MTQTRIYFIFFCNPVYLKAVHKAPLPWTQQDSNLRRWFLWPLTQWLSHPPRHPKTCLAPVPRKLPYSPTAPDLFPTCSPPVSIPCPIQTAATTQVCPALASWAAPSHQPNRDFKPLWQLPVLQQSVRQKPLHFHVKLELYLVTPTRSNKASPIYQFRKILSVSYCSLPFSWWLLAAFTGALMKFSVLQYLWQRGQYYHGWVQPDTLDAVSALLESVWHF